LWPRLNLAFPQTFAYPDITILGTLSTDYVGPTASSFGGKAVSCAATSAYPPHKPTYPLSRVVAVTVAA
jgi:hypothetical protein